MATKKKAKKNIVTVYNANTGNEVVLHAVDAREQLSRGIVVLDKSQIKKKPIAGAAKVTTEETSEDQEKTPKTRSK